MRGHVLIDPGPWLDEIEARFYRVSEQRKSVCTLLDEMNPRIDHLRGLATSTSPADQAAIDISIDIAGTALALVFTVIAFAQRADQPHNDHHNTTRH